MLCPAWEPEWWDVSRDRGHLPGTSNKPSGDQAGLPGTSNRPSGDRIRLRGTSNRPSGDWVDLPGTSNCPFGRENLDITVVHEFIYSNKIYFHYNNVLSIQMHINIYNSHLIDLDISHVFHIDFVVYKHHLSYDEQDLLYLYYSVLKDLLELK